MLSNYSADPYRHIAERFGARAFSTSPKNSSAFATLVAERAAMQ